MHSMIPYGVSILNRIYKVYYTTKRKRKDMGRWWIKMIFLILRKMWKTCEMLACGKQLWYDGIQKSEVGIQG